MKSAGYIFNFKALLSTVITLAIMGFFGYMNLDIDADIVSALPKKDPVLSEAADVISHHPLQDMVILDVSHQKRDTEILVEAGDFIRQRLIQSGLFKNIGLSAFENLIPDLMLHITSNLPVLFTEKELTKKIEPLLTPEYIQQKLKENFITLQDINSIGLMQIMANDPLGFSDVVLPKLLHLSPSSKADFYNGHLISEDGKHLLIIAEPGGSGTDTDFAQKATSLINDVSEKLNSRYKNKEFVFTIDHNGAYRYALENETIAKKDTRRALFLATAGIALMLVLVFPRPVLGLFAFIPAFAGIVTSFFVYSLFHTSISVLALGFGGAIISITIDHGIAYLLFLDREQETRGKTASREVWAVGLLATLTTSFAFFSLFISGFPILEQLGQFAGLGILFSFLFVHIIFPRIFPVLPPANRQKSQLIQNMVNSLALSHPKYKIVIAAVFFCVMLLFAKPVFHVDLSSLNSVSRETLESEKRLQHTWGNVSDRIFMMVEAETIDALQRSGDTIASLMERDTALNKINPSFASSMIFPGIDRAHRNFTEWKKFWTRKRISGLKNNMVEISKSLGFSDDAFESFFRQVEAENFTPPGVPEKFHELMGIEKPLPKENRALYRQFYTMVPGKNYDPSPFFQKYTSLNQVKLFDPGYYTQKLGETLSSTFIRMFVIISLSLTLLLYFWFFDLALTFTALLPVIFAFVCTLGTLKIISHPIDIPGLMLSIVVLGMGIDYSLYFVRSHQRYLKASHESFHIIRISVFLASVSTMIGFGAMCTGEHSLLRSAGITSLLGIFYALAGAFFILPFVLERLFRFSTNRKPPPASISEPTVKNVLKYFKHMEELPRIYAHIKIRLDPMYRELGELLTSPGHFIDIGCGYGVTALWILILFPESSVLGIEPDPERARIADNAFKNRGAAIQGKAPDLPNLPDNMDTTLMIDMAHYLDDNELKITLQKVHTNLRKKGFLLMRVTIPEYDKFSFLRWMEVSRLKLFGIYYKYRTKNEIISILEQSGFELKLTQKSGTGREKVWFKAAPQKQVGIDAV